VASTPLAILPYQLPAKILYTWAADLSEALVTKFTVVPPSVPLDILAKTLERTFVPLTVLLISVHPAGVVTVADPSFVNRVNSRSPVLAVDGIDTLFVVESTSEFDGVIDSTIGYILHIPPIL
jgi:hypothetical protein